jgi:protein-L-isoaspartate O-methyltransferase
MRQLPFWKWNHARILLNFRENGMNRCLLMTRAERLFSTIAPIYDLILSPTLTCLYRKAVAQAIKLVPSLNPNGNGTPGSQKSLNMTALDVGTGTGLLAAALTERGFTVFGIDVSANMLTTARRRRPHAAKFARAPAHCSSMQPGAPFDLVCAGMLMHGLPRSYRQQVFPIERLVFACFPYPHHYWLSLYRKRRSCYAKTFTSVSDNLLCTDIST